MVDMSWLRERLSWKGGTQLGTLIAEETLVVLAYSFLLVSASATVVPCEEPTMGARKVLHMHDAYPSYGQYFDELEHDHGRIEC